MAKLMDDEFAPSTYANSLEFWQIPKGVAKSTELSWGAKVLYAVIYGNAYKRDEAMPSYKALCKHMGNPSKATMQRWIKELVDARLIRTIHRGRGISNIYRIMRSPLLGNMSQTEFDEGRKYVYTGPYTDVPILVDELTALQNYYNELSEWINKSVHPNDYPIPKPYVKLQHHELQATEEARWSVIDRYLFEGNHTSSVECEIDDTENGTTEWVIPENRD